MQGRITAMSAQRFAFVCLQTILLIHNHVLGYRIAGANGQKCEVLTIPTCKNLGYNATFMPNRFNRKTQKDAALEIDKFSPFVEAGCSPMLQLFLCSLYAPPCDKEHINGKGPLPCRSVCENATVGCLALMKDSGIELPWKMESCDLWPSKNDDKTCLSGLDTRPAISQRSFTWCLDFVKLKDEVLTTVTLKNCRVVWVILTRITVTLTLLKNTHANGLFLTNSHVNLLTITSPRADSNISFFLISVINNSVNSMRMINTNAVILMMTMTNNSLNSLTLINTTIGEMLMTNNSLNSFTVKNTITMFGSGSSLHMINNTLGSFTLINTRSSIAIGISNSALNSLKIINGNTDRIFITDSTVNSLTLMNANISSLEIESTNIKLFTLINSRISDLWLRNTTVNSFTQTNSGVSRLTTDSIALEAAWKTTNKRPFVSDKNFGVRKKDLNLPSQPSTNTIVPPTEKPSTNNDSSRKESFGVWTKLTNFNLPNSQPSTNPIILATEKPSTNDHSSTKKSFGVWIELTKLNLPPQPSTNPIALATEKTSRNDHSSTKQNFGVIIAVSKLQIFAHFVLLYSINGFLS